MEVVRGMMDRFMDKYLRVNAKACKAKRGQ